MHKIYSDLNLKLLAPVIVIIVVLAVLAVSLQLESTPEIMNNPIETVDFDYSKLPIMETNGVKHIIPLDKIKGGGPPKDGIPSIDNPIFTNIQNSNFMSDSDTVIGLEINGETKAYPIFILVWHEIGYLEIINILPDDSLN